MSLKNLKYKVRKSKVSKSFKRIFFKHWCDSERLQAAKNGFSLNNSIPTTILTSIFQNLPPKNALTNMIVNSRTTYLSSIPLSRLLVRMNTV